MDQRFQIQKWRLHLEPSWDPMTVQTFYWFELEYPSVPSEQFNESVIHLSHPQISQEFQAFPNRLQ